MAHQSFTKTVLEAVKKEAAARGGEVSTTELSGALMLQTHKKHKLMLSTLCDLVKSSRIVRVRQGVYGVGAPSAPDKREVMWRTLRMRKVVTIADLQEFASVSVEYARQWLRMLVERKIVIRIDPADKTKPSSWRLIHCDQVEMPVDTAKAEKLRKIRAARKRSIQKGLRKIELAVAEILRDLDDTEAAP